MITRFRCLENDIKTYAKRVLLNYFDEKYFY